MSPPTRQILGPLTTPWQQPEGCSVIVRRDSSYTGELWQGQSCQMTASAAQSNYWIHQAHECFPPPTAAATTPTASWYDNWGFYSPGVACPVGWTRACSATCGEVGTALALLDPMTLQAGETAAECCPEGYTCMAGFPKCRRLLTTPFGAIVCDATAVGVQIPVPSPYLNKEGAGTSVASFTVGMPMVQVVWRETDLPASMRSRPSSTTTVAMETNATAPKSTDIAAVGLSEGAKVGLAVGASLGAVIVLISIAFFVFVRRHRRRRAANTATKCQPPCSGTLQQQQHRMQQRGELPVFPSLGELSVGRTGPYTTAELPSHNEKGLPTNRARPSSQPSIKWNLIGSRK
ncbi:hypothetical protein PG997_009634 [Apiospora hydei]|uniref:Uncharacterized protein n=1 Tax=Apiospora hydei TaxID=1337664 RepID=A0ABR1VUP7_9PEZI